MMKKLPPFPFPRMTPARITLALALTMGVPGFQSTAAAQPAAAPGKPAPDVIVFTNGDQLTGSILRGVDDGIVFKSDMAGEITVPLAKIKELHSSNSFAVLRKDTPITRTPVQPGTISVGENSVIVSTSTSAPRTVPDQQLAFIVDAATYKNEIEDHKSLLSGWSGHITAGATIVRSTETGSTFTADIAAVRTIPTVTFLPRRKRTLFNLSETYGQLTQPVIPQTTPPTPASVARTNIFHTDVEQDQYFKPRLYALGIASFDHNYSQGLNLQQIYGGGIGWAVIESPRQQLDLTTNIHYEKQAFQNAANDQNLIGATIGEAYHRNLPYSVAFTESASFLPAFNNTNAYSGNFAAGIALPVYHRFSATFSTTDSYLNNPSPGYKKNSYQLVTGITYALH
jgi:hypothetical protein